MNCGGLLEQAQPVGTTPGAEGVLAENLVVPAEQLSHVKAVKIPAGWAAFSAAAFGVLLATIIYLWRMLNPAEIRDSFKPLYAFLWNKWYFDELYDLIFVKPTHWISGLIAKFDRGIIDGIIHGTAATAKAAASIVSNVGDRTLVDGTVNAFANRTWDFGLMLRRLQTGSLRTYVLAIAMGTWITYMLVSFIMVARGTG